MNSVILIGRLTSDPSLSYTAGTNTAVASFRLAVNRDTKDGGTDFIQCKVFGAQADNLQKWKHKGDEVAVIGRIETGSYTKKDGTKVYTTEVVCNRVEYTHGSKHNAEPEERPELRTFEEGELPDTFAQLDDDIPF